MVRKPITRNEQIKKFSREHHSSLLFCWKIRQGLKNNLQPQRIFDYIQYYWQQNLQPHFREEEKILFAPIKDRQVQRAINEHKQIRRQIEGLANNLAKIDIQKNLARIADKVDDHVRYEERQLFNHIEQISTPGQLEILEKELNNHPVNAAMCTDEFWAKEK